MNYITFNGCTEPLHFFARCGQDGDETVAAFHSDNSLCEGAEFNLTDLLNDELPRMVTCPGCDQNTLNEDDHIRACISFRAPMSEAEIRDAYSDPTEQSKRDSLLAEKA
jgi:hypothetical protein